MSGDEEQPNLKRPVEDCLESCQERSDYLEEELKSSLRWLLVFGIIGVLQLGFILFFIVSQLLSD